MTDRELYVNRMAGFFLGATRLGYDYNETWSLMLNSEQGRGILNREYLYVEHHQGIPSANMADELLGSNY